MYARRIKFSTYLIAGILSIVLVYSFLPFAEGNFFELVYFYFAVLPLTIFYLVTGGLFSGSCYMFCEPTIFSGLVLIVAELFLVYVFVTLAEKALHALRKK